MIEYVVTLDNHVLSINCYEYKSITKSIPRNIF